MIITRAPYRISFFGGGTDYPEWFSKNGGSFLSLSINKYAYIALRVKPAFFEKRYRRAINNGRLFIIEYSVYFYTNIIFIKHIVDD